VSGVICSEFRTFLHAFLDGELDLVRQVEIEDHLRTCGACSRIHQVQLTLSSALKSDELYFRAPAHLERKVRKPRSRRDG
jgi:predicted anti-sigma-YlaC factor YlaD